MIARRVVLQGAAGLVIGFSSLPAQAQDALQLSTTYSNKRFQPAELSVPADRPVTLRVRNSNAKAMEFESKSLRVEKVIAANSEGVLNIRALKPGRYEFFDDFNPDARGAVVVK
jgi:hypothetical protein